MRALLCAALVAAGACGPKARTAVLQTSLGTIKIKLLDQTPATTANFVALASKKFYDGNIFHRVIPELLVQTGDPTGTSQGGSGATIPDELGGKFDRPGLVGMARWGPNTASSQFFITLAPMPDLTGQNALFGEVVEGLEVARAIAKVPRDQTDGKDRPLKPPVLKSVVVR